MTTGLDLRTGRPLLATAGSGGVAHQQHAVAPDALVEAVLAALGV